jgi:hypothetical protein
MKFNNIYFIFFTFIFLFQDCNAQTDYSKAYKQLSSPEKWWVIFHPFIAKKSFRLTQQARTVSKEMAKSSLLDSDENGGQVDAFRHAYWMALLSQNICWKKARWLGNAHEKGNYKDFKKHRMEEGTLPDSASGAMDLFNNARGIEIGKTKNKIPDQQLIDMVRDSIASGKMKVISKDKIGNVLDCQGKKIDPLQYQHHWNIPKCLVQSNYNR